MKITAYAIYQNFQNDWVPLEIQMDKFGDVYDILKITEKRPETKEIAIDTVYQLMIEKYQ